MKAMRLVSRGWQKGFDSSVSAITLSQDGPLLPHWKSLHERFPQLTSLKLGECILGDEGLRNLADLKKLTALSLGSRGGLGQKFPRLKRGHLWQRVTGAGLGCLFGNGGPEGGLERGLGGGLKIQKLSLAGCQQLLDGDLVPLRALSLTSLSLAGCVGLTGGVLAHFAGLPIARLDLSRCPGVGAEGGFEGLRNLRNLTWLGLNSAGVCNSDLEFLRGLPLTNLRLGGSLVTDRGLECLSGMPITELYAPGSVFWGEGFRHFAEMPLATLNLSMSQYLESLQHLRGLPITSLDLSFSKRHLDFDSLQGLPLTSLNICLCKFSPENAGLEFLRGMLLTFLNLGGFLGLTDGVLENLRGLPLATIDLNGCTSLTDACLGTLLSFSLKKLHLRGCDQFSFEVLDELSRNGVIIEG